MKSAFVVLALSGLAKSEPEADPQLLLASSPFAPRFAPFAPRFAPSVYTQQPLIYNAAQPVIAPTFVPSIAPVVATKTVVAPVPSVRAPHPHNCASAEGCAVRALIDHGLAKREADAEPEADAEADPQLIVGGLPGVINTPYAYTNGLYNNYFGLNNLGYAPASPYFAGFNPVAPFAAPVARQVFQTAPVAAPVVQQVVQPAPVVKQVFQPAPVVAAPAPIVKQVFQPAPVVAAPVVKQVFQPAPVVAAPAPVVAVRKPIVQPVVQSRTKKVTYTHLGAHPLTNPATVLETESKVIGHKIF